MQRSAEAVVTPVFEQPTRVRWLMIGLIFVVDVLMFIDRVNISIAAKYIIPEYALKCRWVRCLAPLSSGTRSCRFLAAGSYWRAILAGRPPGTRDRL